MARLIDVDKALAKLRKVEPELKVVSIVGIKAVSIGSVIDFLERQKTVDAAEVKHGRWEKAHVSGYLKCNCCNDAFIYEEWLENGKWNYCPNCGAKLDGDGNEILEI